MPIQKETNKSPPVGFELFIDLAFIAGWAASALTDEVLLARNTYNKSQPL
ncbi:hypothetical protein KBF61_03535 [Candidatus Saccharibacteria bacterium]|nr:hypothetical protein [Candidatus Saccharibacteria bacterium]